LITTDTPTVFKRPLTLHFPSSMELTDTHKGNEKHVGLTS